MAFKVTAPRLSLRSGPAVDPTNRLAVLPRGQVVDKIADTADPGWWQVSTVLDGAVVVGFLARAFLAPEGESSQMAERLAEVHLRENVPSVTRTSAAGRAFPLGEVDRPSRGTADARQRRDALLSIIRYLNVEDPRHERYAPSGGRTFCNVYAHDYCYLSGVYLPRVWWTPGALGELAAGRTIRAIYARTVTELNANALYAWLRDFGPAFGWAPIDTTDALQRAADGGAVAVICAQRADLRRPGHISVVAPEDAPPLVARRAGATVELPLQSQAGDTNFCFSCGSEPWWAGSRFRAFGFWAHP